MQQAASTAAPPVPSLQPLDAPTPSAALPEELHPIPRGAVEGRGHNKRRLRVDAIRVVGLVEGAAAQAQPRSLQVLGGLLSGSSVEGREGDGEGPSRQRGERQRGAQRAGRAALAAAVERLTWLVGASGGAPSPRHRSGASASSTRSSTARSATLPPFASCRDWGGEGGDGC